MKKRNEEKHRRIFSEGKEKEVFQSHQYRESRPCLRRKNRISKHLTVQLRRCICRSYNRVLDSGVVSAQSGGTEPVRVRKKLVIVFVVIVIVRILTRRDVGE